MQLTPNTLPTLQPAALPAAAAVPTGAAVQPQQVPVPQEQAGGRVAGVHDVPEQAPGLIGWGQIPQEERMQARAGGDRKTERRDNAPAGAGDNKARGVLRGREAASDEDFVAKRGRPMDAKEARDGKAPHLTERNIDHTKAQAFVVTPAFAYVTAQLHQDSLEHFWTALEPRTADKKGPAEAAAETFPTLQDYAAEKWCELVAEQAAGQPELLLGMIIRAPDELFAQALPVEAPPDEAPRREEASDAAMQPTKTLTFLLREIATCDAGRAAQIRDLTRALAGKLLARPEAGAISAAELSAFMDAIHRARFEPLDRIKSEFLDSRLLTLTPAQTRRELRAFAARNAERLRQADALGTVRAAAMLNGLIQILGGKDLEPGRRTAFIDRIVKSAGAAMSAALVGHLGVSLELASAPRELRREFAVAAAAIAIEADKIRGSKGAAMHQEVGRGLGLALGDVGMSAGTLTELLDDLRGARIAASDGIGPDAGIDSMSWRHILKGLSQIVGNAAAGCSHADVMMQWAAPKFEKGGETMVNLALGIADGLAQTRRGQDGQPVRILPRAALHSVADFIFRQASAMKADRLGQFTEHLLEVSDADELRECVETHPDPSNSQREMMLTVFAPGESDGEMLETSEESDEELDEEAGAQSPQSPQSPPAADAS